MKHIVRSSIAATSVLGLAWASGNGPAAQAPPRPVLQLVDYAQAPITGELGGQNTRGQLARVNYLRDEPGGRRFFVNDLNGPLYIVDKQTRAFTTYLDFNGLSGRPGIFPRFTFERNFATGLTSFVFDPDYARNGVFYTLHMEDPSTPGPANPRAVAGLDLAGYTTTPAVQTPTVGGRIEREVVLVEWKDRNISNATFEGTARELLRVQHPLAPHPLAEMTFNPIARPGDADWRVMYLGAGDAQTGEQRDSRRLNPQRLDTLMGKILRIVPDLAEHRATSAVSENGRYRIPSDNPFVGLPGARGEIWAYGLRNPHRLSWDVDPSQGGAPTLFAFNIGLTAWESVVIVRKGANYGYPLREGSQVMSLDGMGPLPTDDTIPVQVSDTVTSGTVTPTYPVVQYSHEPASGGDAIAGGFVYRGTAIPALSGKLVFGDITTGRLWYADVRDVLAADDGIAGTVAPIQEFETGLRGLVEATYRSRGGLGATIPGVARVSGAGRVDVRLAVDNEGELYLLTKTDGAIRKVVGVSGSLDASRMAASPSPAATDVDRGAAATLMNPVAATPASVEAGRKYYEGNCAACHGNAAQGAVRAGLALSIIEEQNGRQPPDLTDDRWDHGSSDGEIFTVIKRGLPPTMMPGFEGGIPDNDIWSVVNYLRSLRQTSPVQEGTNGGRR
ncbi:MAG: PQQ-dependent sugar dehydrogenase [Acidobacteria bacterium]|nr:PQQ-dependent sugar dehydrogenase [Acidobacteriota bacterium]